MEPETTGSTVPRRQLGRFLRRLREEAGLTVKAASDGLDCSVQKLWRIEKGAVPVRAGDVAILCRIYRAPAELTTALMGLARETKAKGWWHSYGDAVPDWFEQYVGLEGAAGRIRKYEPSLVPGLLQARAYMEAVIRANQPAMGQDDVARRVAIKIERQGLLSRHFPPPPRLEVLICEGALRRPPDVPGAMAQQLWHLLKANELPHVSVRVLPLAGGPHRASPYGPFTILNFPGADGGAGEPPIVFSESLTGALYLDRPAEIAAYDDVWTDLDRQSLGEGESNKMITAVIGEMNHSV